MVTHKQLAFNYNGHFNWIEIKRRYQSAYVLELHGSQRKGTLSSFPVPKRALQNFYPPPPCCSLTSSFLFSTSSLTSSRMQSSMTLPLDRHLTMRRWMPHSNGQPLVVDGSLSTPLNVLANIPDPMLHHFISSTWISSVIYHR